MFQESYTACIVVTTPMHRTASMKDKSMMMVLNLETQIKHLNGLLGITQVRGRVQVGPNITTVNPNSIDDVQSCSKGHKVA